MAFIQIRIDDKEKAHAQEIFESMGMSMSGALKLFIRKTIQEERLPFEIVATKSVPKSSEPSNKPIKKEQITTDISPKKDGVVQDKPFTNFTRKRF